jgi:hypothetical protein
LFSESSSARGGVQSLSRVLVGVSRHDLAEIDAVKIPGWVGIVEDCLDQSIGRHVVSVKGPAFVVHNALRDDRGPDLFAWNHCQARFLELVVVPARERSAEVGGGGQFPRRHVDSEITSLFEAAVGETAGSDQHDEQRPSLDGANGAPSDDHHVGLVGGVRSYQQEPILPHPLRGLREEIAVSDRFFDHASNHLSTTAAGLAG